MGHRMALHTVPNIGFIEYSQLLLLLLLLLIRASDHSLLGKVAQPSSPCPRFAA
jgi:hypothetical protein